MLRPIDRRNVTARYILAGVLCLAAASLTALIPTRPSATFLIAIAATTWLGGAVPGALAAALTGTLGWALIYRHLLPPPPDFSSRNYLGFLGTCLLIYAMGVALNRLAIAQHKSSLRFGGIVQMSEDAIIAVDEQGCITLFNSGAEKIFRYRANEILGQPLNRLLPERQRAAHDAHVREFSKAHDGLRAMNERGAIAGRRANGEEFPAEASISKFEFGGDKILTVRLRDVTERRAIEQHMRQLAGIVESSPDAIVSEDLEGRIVSWNPGAEKMYGYSRAEAIGKDARMLLPKGASDEVSENIRRAVEGKNSTSETVRMHKDGKPIEVALSISPVRNRNGEMVGLATIARDITDRKRLEQQLLHSQKMEAVGRLAGGIAHDFNNLLSIIVGYTYLIKSSTKPEQPIHAAAEQIMSASERAASLTRQLLAFSRKQIIRPEVINLNEVTSGIGKIIPRLVSEEIDVRIVKHEPLPSIQVDPGQIEQVIMNLVVNARDAMPKGGKLTIETGTVAFSESEARHHGIRSGNYVLLAISDTGIGMDENTRSRIFEPFFTTKEAGKGTGLGLATVYGIVNQSNGHIWVYSEPDQGTTFKIYFPAIEAAVESAQAVHRPELTVCGTEAVLLVEDEEHLRELLSHVLRDNGYDVRVAANGQEALRLIEEQKTPIDLLISDVVMPGMRGQQLAEHVLRKYPQISIIYMSGYTDNALIHSGSLPEDTTFLQKPFTPDAMLQHVREVLDRRADHRNAREKAG